MCFDVLILVVHKLSHRWHVYFKADQIALLNVSYFRVDGSQVFDDHEPCFVDLIDLPHATQDVSLFVD